MITYALAYQLQGFHVFPVGNNKRPIVEWEEFQTRPATAEEITKWWTKWPNANIGIVTGTVPGIVVIDIESAKGLDAYVEKYGMPTKTLIQRTGKENGMHLIKRHSRNGMILQNQVKTLPDVDTRGDGGYILIGPSRHPSGRRYQLIDCDPLKDNLFDLITDLDPGTEQLFKPYRPSGNGDGKAHTSSTPQGDEEGHFCEEDGKTYTRKNPPGWQQEYLEGFDEHERNSKMVQIIGWWFYMENDRDIVLGNALKLNEKNRPPLDKKEVVKIVDSIKKTRDKKKANGPAKKIFDEIESRFLIVYLDGRKHFRLTFKNGRTVQPTDADFSSVAKFESLFRFPLGRSPRLKKEGIDDLYDLITKDIQVIKASLEESPDGAVAIEIAGYLENVDGKFEHLDIHPLKDKGGQYFPAKIVGGVVYVHAMNFLRFLHSLQAEGLFATDAINRTSICRMLRNLGFDNERMRVSWTGPEAWAHHWHMTLGDWTSKMKGYKEYGSLTEKAVQDEIR